MAIFAVGAVDPVKFEGSTGQVAARYTFTITRTGDLSVAGSVHWRLVVGDGFPPVDFDDFETGMKNSGTADFAPNVASVQLTFKVNPDTDAEPNEGFGIEIDSPSGADTIATGSAFVEVKDDDARHYVGTANDETLDLRDFTKGTVGDVSQGGIDKIIGGAFDDTVLFGASFTNVDRFDGGEGNDRAILEGDYSRGVTLLSSTFRSVERIDFIGDFDYKLIIGNAAVAAGATLQIDAAISGAYSANVNAAAESDGRIHFHGGAGADVFTGGKLDDRIDGDAGADMLNGAAGADIFVYRDWVDSPLIADAFGNIFTVASDTLVQFRSSQDKIDLSEFGFLGEETAVLTKSTNGFTSNLNVGSGFFGTAGVAVEYAKVGKAVTARIYVDVDKDGNLGQRDQLIQATGVAKGGIRADAFDF